MATVRVWLLSLTGGLAGSTETAGDGTYRFASIAHGSYKVSFNVKTSTHGSVFYPDAPDLALGAVVTVGATPLTIDARLYPTALQPIPGYSGTATGRKIAVIGDSLIQTTTSVQLGRLQPLGLTSVVGLNAQRVDQMQPVATRFAPLSPTTVVIALGTNDNEQQWPLSQTLAALTTMIDTFASASCIVLVNVNAHTASGPFNARARVLNTAMANLLSSDPRGRVVDWAARADALYAGGNGGSYFTDGIHFTASGMAEYAASIHDVVASCPTS